MVLEATIVCVDTSDWMRNGDYLPSRMQAQADAVNLLAGAKTQDNPESSVGVLAYGGPRPRVLVALTQELGEVLTKMSTVSIERGEDASLCKGVAMAQLALKHRQNKNQRQRVVLFIGSPCLSTVSAAELVALGKKLKKNNVALDIVDMASDEDTTKKCEALIESVGGRSSNNNNENGSGGEGDVNSHLVVVPARSMGFGASSSSGEEGNMNGSGGIVSDMLLSSPIFGMGADGDANRSGFAAAAMAGAAAAAAANNNNGDGGGAGLDEFGVDPNLDPELALALRVSMEEERARQQASKDNTNNTSDNGEEGKQDGNEAKNDNADGEMDVDKEKDGSAAAPTSATEDMSAAAAAVVEDVEMMDEDVLLQQALAMSMGQTATGAADKVDEDKGVDEDAEDDDPTLAMALKMSMENHDGEASMATAADSSKPTDTPGLHDPAYVASVLGSLPGVDPDDPAVKAALAGLSGGGALGTGTEEEDEKKDEEMKEE